MMHEIAWREGRVPNVHLSWGRPRYRLFFYVCLWRGGRWSWLWRRA